MGQYEDLTQEQIEKLSHLIAKYMKVTLDDARGMVYEEYDLAEELINSSKKIKDAAKKFVSTLNELYRIA